MTVVDRQRAKRSWGSRSQQRNFSGRSDLAEEVIDTLEVEPESVADWWTSEASEARSAEDFGFVVVQAKTNRKWGDPAHTISGSYARSGSIAPLLSFMGTISDQWLRSASPVDVVWRTLGSAKSQPLARDWEQVTRHLSGTVFGDEGLTILRLHELAHLIPSYALDVDIDGETREGVDPLGSASAEDPREVTAELRLRAESWLGELGLSQEQPHRSESPWGDVVFEWWYGDKKLTIYFGHEHIEYVKVWGDNIDEEMDDGTIADHSGFDELWRWLRA